VKEQRESTVVGIGVVVDGNAGVVVVPVVSIGVVVDGNVVPVDRLEVVRRVVAGEDDGHSGGGGHVGIVGGGGHVGIVGGGGHVGIVGGGGHVGIVGGGGHVGIVGGGGHVGIGGGGGHVGIVGGGGHVGNGGGGGHVGIVGGQAGHSVGSVEVAVVGIGVVVDGNAGVVVVVPVVGIGVVVDGNAGVVVATDFISQLMILSFFLNIFSFSMVIFVPSFNSRATFFAVLLIFCFGEQETVELLKHLSFSYWILKEHINVSPFTVISFVVFDSRV